MNRLLKISWVLLDLRHESLKGGVIDVTELHLSPQERHAEVFSQEITFNAKARG